MLPKCCSELGFVCIVVVIETSIGGISTVVNETSLCGISTVTLVGGVSVVPSVSSVTEGLRTVGGVLVLSSDSGVMVVEVVVSDSVGDMLNSMDIVMLQLILTKEIDTASSVKSLDVKV